MAIKKKIKHGLTVWLARVFFHIFNIVPRNMAVFMGASIGIVAWGLLPRERYRINRHLQLAYNSKLNQRQRTEIGRKFFINSGKNIVEFIRFKKYFDSEIVPLVEVEGLHHFEKAKSERRGIIGISGHIGNFELMAVYLNHIGFEVGVIGRELYDRRLDALLVSNRESMGIKNFSTDGSPREVLKWLKDGKTLGVLIDTDSMRVRSTFVPSFGRLSNTPIGQTLIGLRAKAAFLPCFCLRTTANQYKIILGPEIIIKESDDMEKMIYQVTADCTRSLERIINQNKDQWIWLHNRWHTKPKETA